MKERFKNISSENKSHDIQHFNAENFLRSQQKSTNKQNDNKNQFLKKSWSLIWIACPIKGQLFKEVIHFSPTCDKVFKIIFNYLIRSFY